MRIAALALRVAVLAAAVLALALLPRYIGDFRAFQFATIGVYFIAILGLGILTGHTGQISLGHGAFMAIGGYTTAILVADHGWKDLATIPVAGLVAGVAGLIFGIPALRLTGLYLALATFAIAVAAPAVIKKFEGFTGGGSGIDLFTEPGLTGAAANAVHPIGRTVTFNDWLYYLTWTIAVVLAVAAWLLVRGRVGRALRAARDSEIAAASSGVNLAVYKTLAFAVSAFYAGIAGSLFAISVAFVNPETFPIRLSLELLIGLVVGGLVALAPLILGAAFVVLLPTWAPEISNAPGLPSVIYGGVVILLMFAIPSGIGGALHRLVEPLTMRLYSRS